ncbi:Ger(x)C family germination protein [Clostridium pascui]|uniref:Ger(x)C family spore germination protein n=1 Tax=Clostridium pascui TaxID=46609 RepID=UPI00195E0678|nr:Ger(x)C family spore germination protein [Clostridium pascui]MBM7870464.1 Ger(x)C family germination protein [Clostridium pascui]
MNKIIIFCSILMFILFTTIGGEPQREAAEDLSIPAGVGIDIEKKGFDNISYKISISSYVFEEEKTISRVTTGSKESIGQSRQNRQLEIDKRFLIGLEKTDIISEEYATEGIRNLLDILFNNPDANDTALVAVCRGDAKTILEYPIAGYPSSADYIEGMIKNSKAFNFFTNNYKIIDIFVRLDSEGRSFTVPYLVLTNEGLKIEGLALFKSDKMIGKVGIHDAKVLNMLSDGSGKGVITVKKNSKEYVDYYAECKRKVKCERENGKYNFNISLKLKGEIIANELNRKVFENEEEKSKLEKEIERQIEERCNKFLKLMQEEYRVDFLELGRIAAAKYGRDTGTDWNEEVANSNIKVEVKAKIERQGRGDY